MGVSFFHVENMPKIHYVIVSNHPHFHIENILKTYCVIVSNYSHKPTSMYTMKSKSSSVHKKSNSYSEDEDS